MWIVVIVQVVVYVVLLVMTGCDTCRLLHILIELGKKDVLNTCVQCGHRAGCSAEYSEWML